MKPGDRYLLCTDDLHRVIARAQIQSALAAAPDPEAAVDALSGLANAAGGLDNIGCAMAGVIDL